MKVNGRHVIFALICFVLGFMLAFSYQMTNQQLAKHSVTNRQWDKEYTYRQQLIEQQEKNQQLKRELLAKQAQVRDIEKKLADERQSYVKMVEEAETLRMYTGKVKVKGKGIEVKLADASYVPSEANATNYIVHERHIFKVVHELFIAGASAVAINGQRLSRRSYIVCNGPVIEVDGVQHPAPFIIRAIGDPKTLVAALTMAGGVKEQLMSDRIIVDIVEKEELTIDPIFRNQ